jgi:hypothetical protein
VSYSDELVNRWFISEWTDPEGRWRMHPKYDSEIHGPVSDLKVVTTDGKWECGCYSSWTRDDEMILTAHVETVAGEVKIEYGAWADFPDFVLAIIDFGELENVCRIEGRDDESD